MVKKISFNTIILFIQILMTFFTLLLTVEYIEKVNLLNTIQRGFYSSYLSKSYMYNPLSEKNFSLIIDDLYASEKNFSLHFTEPELALGIRGVYFSEESSTPPLTEGRFFFKEEMESNANIAIIGKEKLTNTYNINKKRFINIEGIEFEVIGVIGTNGQTRLDKMIWVPFYTAISMTDGIGVICLDGSDSKSIFKMQEKVNRYLGINDPVNKDSSKTNRKFYDFITNINHMTLLFSMSIFLYIISFIVVLHWWIDTKNQRIKIQSILGFSKLQILQGLFCDYSKIFIISVVIGMVITCISSSVKIENILKCVLEIYLTSIIIFILSILGKWKKIEMKGQ